MMGAIGSFFAKMIEPLVNAFFFGFSQLVWGGVVLALEIINGVIKGFEWLAFENWSDVLFGTKNGETTFFPKTNSPLFLLWIAMLSLGILLLIIFLTIWGIRKIKGNQGLIDVTPQSEGVFLRGIYSIVLLFFVPFGLMTGMGFTRVVTHIMFGEDTPSTNQRINSTKMVLDGKLNSIATDIYKFPSKQTISFSNTYANPNPNSLYSHNKVGRDDTLWNNWLSGANSSGGSTTPFKDINGVLEKVKQEIVIFNKSILGLLPTDITDISSSLSSTIGNYLSTYGVGGSEDIEKVFKDLSLYSNSASATNKNDNYADDIAEAKKKINSYQTETYNLLSLINELIKNKDTITFILDKADVNIVNALGIGGNIVGLKDTQLLKTLGAKTTTSDILKETEALMSIYNIQSLSTTFLFGDKWEFGKWLPITKIQAKKDVWYTTHQTTSLESLAWDSYVLVKGYSLGNETISLFDLTLAYSTRKTTELVVLVYQIASGNTDKDWKGGEPKFSWTQALPRSAIGVIMVLSIISIFIQLIKRIVWRFGKLGWLWIMGMPIIPSSITDGGGRAKVWVSMVAIELISLFSMMAMWYIWKSMSSVLIAEAHKVPTGSNIANGVIAFAMITGFLELIIQSADWLANILGGSDTYKSSTQLASGKDGISKVRQANALGGKGVGKLGKLGGNIGGSRSIVSRFNSGSGLLGKLGNKVGSVKGFLGK